MLKRTAKDYWRYEQNLGNGYQIPKMIETKLPMFFSSTGGKKFIWIAAQQCN